MDIKRSILERGRLVNTAKDLIYKHFKYQQEILEGNIDTENITQAFDWRLDKHMKKELELKLQQEFDFMQRKGTETLYQQYGCECGDGWYDLIYAMCTELSTIGGFEPLQIKQKYGTLRVYGNCSEERGYEIISRYEDLSEHICEECSADGSEREIYGWYSVLCEKCYEDRDLWPRS